MIIGGNDIIVPVAMNTPRLYSLLSAVRLWWPEAYLQDAIKSRPLIPPLEVPCELFIYKDLAIRRLIEKDGVTPEVDPFFFSLIANAKEVTFVVGAEETEGDRIVQDLRRLIGCFG